MKGIKREEKDDIQQRKNILLESMMVEKQHIALDKLNQIQGQVPSGPIKSYPKVDPPSTSDRLHKTPVFGLVRGSPYGACLEDSDSRYNREIMNNGRESVQQRAAKREEIENRTKQWSEWRTKNCTPIHFPLEGFDHIYGKETIHGDDYGAEAAAMAALDPASALNALDNDGDEEVTAKEGREYGSIRTPLDAPIGSLKDKWRVLPHFLQVRSLMRQHIDSFDYFVNVEMKEIVQSPSACEIRSEHDPKFYLRYTDCWVGEPSVQEDSYTATQVTPFQCRLRDCTYSAPIYVNVRYTRGKHIVKKKKVRFV